jgi:hypothetical protein
VPKKKQEAEQMTALDYVQEALVQARYAYTFLPSSYTYGTVTALTQAERMLLWAASGSPGKQ